MAQAGEFMSIFSMTIGLISTLLALGAGVLVVITCVKVMKYIDFKMKR